jgi:hypothetical protein
MGDCFRSIISCQPQPQVIDQVATKVCRIPLSAMNQLTSELDLDVFMAPIVPRPNAVV